MKAASNTDKIPSSGLQVTDNSHLPSSRFDPCSDEQVWHSFMEGDDEALIYMYSKNVNRLLRFGAQFIQREVVKDSIQDLFLNLKERKGTVAVQRIAPYLYKALYRIIRKKVLFIERSDLKPHADDFRNWQIQFSTEHTWIDREETLHQSQALQKQLNELSDKQRQALLLYYYEGFTHEEIKNIMELSHKSSVRKLIERAIGSLRASMRRT